MTSIRKRFLFSAGANIFRAAISLIVGLLVARGLGPADYGNLAYLLGSFWAIRALLDMGTSSAFYTFIAQRGRGRRYYLVYFGWLIFQFLFSVALVASWLPSALVERFWLGQERDVILLAWLATFLQNQVWQTVVQIHEAERKTIRVQVAGGAIILVHLAIVASMLVGQWLSIQAVLWAIVAEYSVATAWLSVMLRKPGCAPASCVTGTNDVSVKSVLWAYFLYCRPMIVISIFAFCYEMADRWLLQRFGGGRQQGFYQVASQLSTISLLATSSILNIFWKEIAEANERQDHERVAGLYQKTTQLLVFLAAVVSCFFAPWAELLVEVLLGPAYHGAWPVLLLMLFYPIYQTVGQINGTLFMATGRNSAYMKITVAGLLVGIPLSYALIVPGEGGWFPGQGLGAMGLALKIVGLNFLFVNIQSWAISRYYGIELQWRSQAFVIVLLLAIGYGCRLVADQFLTFIPPSISASARVETLVGIGAGGVVYLGCILALLMRKPGLAGMSRNEVTKGLQKVSRVVCRG